MQGEVEVLVQKEVVELVDVEEQVVVEKKDLEVGTLLDPR